MSIQSDIGIWHRATFGEGDLWHRIIDKMREEFGEFLDDCGEPSELADIVICCYAYADRLGWDLDTEVRSKFVEVEKRTNQVERDAARGIV